jgi:pyruvate dehydrogenase E1 component alpha subunit
MTTNPLPPERQRELYRQMLLIRRFDERSLELRQADAIEGVVHPYIGQEAVAVGVCANLRREDRITSTHRGHGHCIAKGADPRRMMAELFGRVDGYCRGLGGSMHIADFDIGMLGANGIVGAGLPIAAGSALAATLMGEDAVTVCFFSDGASNEGEFHESLNLSALWGLPIVWVCENNGWAAGTPVDAGLAAEGPVVLAAAFGIEHAVVDGNDVEAVHEAAAHAVAHARDGQGPAFVEARTFRMSSHSVRNAPLADGRDPDVMAHWAGRDPIARYGERLVARRALDDAAIAAIAQSVDDELDAAIAFARESPIPAGEDALAGFYAEAVG